METKHPFKCYATNIEDFAKVNTIDKFVKKSFENSRKQNFFLNPIEDPTKGDNNYFGMALESLMEVALYSDIASTTKVDVHDYFPFCKDEFKRGVDGKSTCRNDNLDILSLGIQIKNSKDSQHLYNLSNSNIGNMVAAAKIDNYDKCLFITTGLGIHPDTLSWFNSNEILVRVLNRDALGKIFNYSNIFEQWYQILVDK